MSPAITSQRKAFLMPQVLTSKYRLIIMMLIRLQGVVKYLAHMKKEK